MWKSTVRSGELVISGILFCIGLLAILMSRAMPPGEYSVPGPAFFPTLLGILLCGVSLILSVGTLLCRTTHEVKIGHRYIWSTIIAIFVLAFFFERFGFILMMALFVGFFLRILSDLKWTACVLWAVVATSIAYLFFHLLIGVQLPSARWF